MSQAELVSRMEWLLQEVDKKTAELMRKTSEAESLQQETARMMSSASNDSGPSSDRLMQQVQVSSDVADREQLF